jgi:hypothetical protein
MSKNKNKRKETRAQEKARENAARARLGEAKVANPVDKTDNTTTTQPDGKNKEKKPVAPSKVKERFLAGDRLLILFNGILAAVAVFQGFILNNQLGVMRNDERAWLEVKTQDGMVIHVITGQPINYPLKLSNVGKTPAKNIVWSIFVEVQDSNYEVRLDCVDRVGKNICNQNRVSSGGIFPNTHWDYTSFRVANDFSPNVATQSEVDAWENGRAYAAVYGIVNYDDIFGTHHWTKFCIWTPPDNKGKYFQTTKCSQYSDVDPN